MGLQASSNIVISYRSFRSQFKLIGLWFRMVNWLVEKPVMWILKKKEIQPNLEQDKRLVQHSQDTNKDVLLIQPDINVQRSTKK